MTQIGIRDFESEVCGNFWNLYLMASVISCWGSQLQPDSLELISTSLQPGPRSWRVNTRKAAETSTRREKQPRKDDAAATFKSPPHKFSTPQRDKSYHYFEATPILRENTVGSAGEGSAAVELRLLTVPRAFLLPAFYLWRNQGNATCQHSHQNTPIMQLFNTQTQNHILFKNGVQ